MSRAIAQETLDLRRALLLHFDWAQKAFCFGCEGEGGRDNNSAFGPALGSTSGEGNVLWWCHQLLLFHGRMQPGKCLQSTGDVLEKHKEGNPTR